MHTSWVPARPPTVTVPGPAARLGFLAITASAVPGGCLCLSWEAPAEPNQSAHTLLLSCSVKQTVCPGLGHVLLSATLYNVTVPLPLSHYVCSGQTFCLTYFGCCCVWQEAWQPRTCQPIAIRGRHIHVKLQGFQPCTYNSPSLSCVEFSQSSVLGGDIYIYIYIYVIYPCT